MEYTRTFYAFFQRNETWRRMAVDYTENCFPNLIQWNRNRIVFSIFLDWFGTKRTFENISLCVHSQKYISASFRIEWSYMWRFSFRFCIKSNSVQNCKENCLHDHIPFNLKGKGNRIFSVRSFALRQLREQKNGEIYNDQTCSCRETDVRRYNEVP